LYRDGTGNGTGVALTSRQISFVDCSMFDDLTGILKLYQFELEGQAFALEYVLFKQAS
jgi:hypothetical protein